MLATLDHRLSARKVKHDHIETILSEEIEGEEVPDLQLVSYGEAGPPLTNSKFPIDFTELHPPVAADVRP